MGQYYLIVNTDKKQYLDAYCFGEGVADQQIVSGYHAQALALLVCNMGEIYGNEGTLMSTWCGDNVLITGDYALPDQQGIKTSTAENFERNLYQMARSEFEDISYKALAMLCETHELISYKLAERAANPRYKRLIFHLGNLIEQVGCCPLENALFDVLGASWKKQYQQIAVLYTQQAA